MVKPMVKRSTEGPRAAAAQLPLPRARQEPELASSQHPLPAPPPGPGLSCSGRSRAGTTSTALLCSDPRFSTHCHGTDMGKSPKPNLLGANAEQHPKPAVILLLAPPSRSLPLHYSPKIHPEPLQLLAGAPEVPSAWG